MRRGSRHRACREHVSVLVGLAGGVWHSGQLSATRGCAATRGGENGGVRQTGSEDEQQQEGS